MSFRPEGGILSVAIIISLNGIDFSHLSEMTILSLNLMTLME